MKKPNRVGAGEHSRRPVIAIVTEDTSGAEFETDKSITDTPTTFLTFDIEAEAIEITEIFWMINPTAAETYRLMLFEGAVADDILSLAKLVFDSGAALVDSQPYRETQGGIKLPVIAKLDTAGRLYYATDWTGAPGNTLGILVVKGYALVGD